ncbi:MAG TPA: sulfotransferase [Candidatus Thermoplasmatota archaeon]|nr:sulfotransferase [Candidatus Thermoplasmatota archaeon]
MKTKNKQHKQMNNKTTQHPLFGISLRHWIHLVKKNGGIDRAYLHRALFITVISLATTPIRMLFNIKYEKKINEVPVRDPPVFIIGHWRSGTTYLHELLSNDPQFCYTTLWSTLLPEGCLILEPIKRFLARFLPSERPMDAIKVDMDGPYEDEAALAVLCPWSFFHCLHFPRNAEEQYQKSIHFQGFSSEEKNQWKVTYLKFIKTILYMNPGKRFLSKNPPNTARISTLLEVFPEAKFIHIYRSPYLVYLSTKKMRMKVLDKLALQDASEEEIEKQVVSNYIRLMNSFFEQKEQIKTDRFVEVRYEDLIVDPMKHIQRIYETLKIPGFETATPAMMKYLDRQSEYKTNVYSIDQRIVQHVDKNWKFTIDRWRYTPPK